MKRKLKKYNVFLCPELRVKIVDIEACTQLEAIKKAEELFGKRQGIAEDIFRFLQNLAAPGAEYVELSEDCFNALVDEQGDENYSKSMWYNCEDSPKWVKRFVPPMVINRSTRAKLKQTAVVRRLGALLKKGKKCKS